VDIAILGFTDMLTNIDLTIDTISEQPLTVNAYLPDSPTDEAEQPARFRKVPGFLLPRPSPAT